MVLALSNEDDEKVQGFVEANGYTVRTAAGATSGAAYGVKGIPDAVLIGPDGKILWRGGPASLSGGRIKDALKGVKKPSDAGFLALPTSLSAEGPLSKAVEAAAEGKLAKALTTARSLAEDPSADEGARADAATLVREIEDYADLLNAQAAAFVERLDLVPAIEVYEAVAKELSGTPAGQAATERLDAIRKDARLQDELKAAEAYDKLKRSSAKLSTSKKRKKYEEFANKHEGTKAAEKARAWAQAN